MSGLEILANGLAKANVGRIEQLETELAETLQRVEHLERREYQLKKDNLDSLDLLAADTAKMNAMADEIDRLTTEKYDLVKEGLLQRHSMGEQADEIESLEEKLQLETVENLQHIGTIRWYEEMEIPKKDKLIGQMRFALELMLSSGNNILSVENARAALSAAERGE